MRLLIVLMLASIVCLMGAALVALLQRRAYPSLRLVRALTLRISLSLLLFAFLLIAYGVGWIQAPGRP